MIALHRRRIARPVSAALALTVASVIAAGCGSSGSTSAQGPGIAGQTVPTAKLPVLKKIGKGEGQLNLIAWEGYLNPIWVKPFEQQTGCQVNAKYAGSSDEMVALMKNGGGGQYDMVSSSGDADLRILYAGDAHPVNINLIPSWKDFFPAFQSPPFNTINGVHYGVSLQWGPNVLMYNTKDFPAAPPSWSVIYDSKYKGQVTVPDNPIQIADAALYLSKHKPSLGITDPYELTPPQFQASVNLLAGQRPLIEKYWDLASQEIFDFKNGNAVVGAGWPYQVSALKADHFSIGDTIPSEGATAGGHLDAGGQGTAPELRLPVDALHQHPEGPGRAGGQLRRDPGQQARLPDHEPVAAGVLRPVPRQRADQLLQRHQAVEDADPDLRQRQDRLRALLRVGVRVEHPGQVRPVGGAGRWQCTTAAGAGTVAGAGSEDLVPRHAGGGQRLVRGRGPPCCSPRHWPARC